jgi:anti-sigma regulatory factor (Ser/Thr protein kinase)
LEIILTGQPGERQRLVEAFEDFCRHNAIPDSTRQAVDVSLEEHLTNVFTHGYRSGAQALVKVRLEKNANALQVEVSDHAWAFDPLTVPPVDTSVPLEQKPIGGLGLHLIRLNMDELSYERCGEENVFRMVKRFPAPPQ